MTLIKTVTKLSHAGFKVDGSLRISGHPGPSAPTPEIALCRSAPTPISPLENSPSMDRRHFLRLAGAAAATGSLPLSIRKALAIPANNQTGTIQDVEHVVVLMQENRAFNHYFGTLPGVRGFGDRITIPLPGGRSVWEQLYAAEGESPRVIMPYHLDQTQGNAQRVSGTPHGWSDGNGAWDKGRMSQWPTYKQPQSMGYYEDQEVEFQRALADAFTVCDNYHCGIHSSTNPNRLFHWTGTNDPSGAGGGPAIGNAFDSLGPSTEGYTWTTYPERLQQAGVSWKVYQNLPNNFTDNPLAGLVQYRRANEAAGNNADGSPYPAYDESADAGNPLYKGVANTLPGGNVANPFMLKGFRDDVAAGKLPQVSWIIAPDAYSEHPGPSSPVQGAWYIQEVLNTLTENPEVFSKTVFIVNFDENDGFFDHVPPPCAPSLDDSGQRLGRSTVSIEGETHSDGQIYGPGPRVPCTIISPWSRGGWVCSQSFDHTSVLQFLEQRFGVTETNISPWRRAMCGDLMSAFNFADPNSDTAPTLPERTKLEADLLRFSQDARQQIAVPSESEQQLPRQPAGVKPARALPYELHATSALVGGSLRVLFANTGFAGAVFHAYDRMNLEAGPRRFGVEAGKMLDDTWDTTPHDGRYDLWVLSTNGWHRHFAGNTRSPDIEVKICYDVANGDVQLVAYNNSDSVQQLRIVDNAYAAGGPWTMEIGSGGDAQRIWPLAGSGHWYDFTATIVGDDSGWSRRFAGRVETGRPGISDPAMGA